MELGLSSSDFSAATVQPSRQFGIIALFFAFVYYSLLWYRSVFKFLDLSKFRFRPLPPQAVPPLQRRRQGKKYNCKMQKRDVEGAVPYGFYVPPRYVVTRDVEGAVPYGFYIPLRYVVTRDVEGTVPYERRIRTYNGTSRAPSPTVFYTPTIRRDTGRRGRRPLRL